MSLYETLKAAKIGAASDVFTTLRAQQAPFAKRSAPTEKELEGALPLSFFANGENLIAYSIDGNKSQSSFCGEKTVNLWDNTTWAAAVNTVKCTKEALPTGIKIISTGGDSCLGEAFKSPSTIPSYRRAQLIEVSENTDYTLSLNSMPKCYISYVDNDYNVLNEEYIRIPTGNTYSFTTPQNCKYIIFRIGKEMNENEEFSFTDIMLNTGSTAIPYEPYNQYKLPIVCGGETNNIYIGANPLRKSLDGTAVDTVSSNGTLTRRVDSDGSVLETPTTETVTVPTIPTVNGSNTFNVNTTLAPSNVYIKYKG